MKERVDVASLKENKLKKRGEFLFYSDKGEIGNRISDKNLWNG